MNIYVVGGAVRDELLGIPAQDYDYVVVGATLEEMVAQGFRPVGQDFPVFLHPHTQAEYALARTERKTARGYHGFQFYYAPDVTLESDLARRDLTINAMARAANLEGMPIGPIIDPHHGQTDLKAGVLRHISPAFAEDPVRILRVARFAARLPHFTIAEDTLRLMRTMVSAGEVDALVPERVWQEISQGLMTDNPWRTFEVLHACGALARIAPEVDLLFSDSGISSDNTLSCTSAALEHAQAALTYVATQGYALSVRFATLAIALMPALTRHQTSVPSPSHDQAKQLAPEKLSLSTLCNRLKVPNTCRDLALLAAREFDAINNAFTSSASTLVQLLERCDALRKPDRFAEAIQVCEAHRCHSAGQITPYPQADRLREALIAMRAVNTAAIAAETPNAPSSIKQAIHQARVAAVEAVSW